MEFLRGLRLAQGIADRKSTMPMLANVLLRTQGKNHLALPQAATRLEREIRIAGVRPSSRFSPDASG